MASDLERLAPGFIVASPSLVDPNFDHTVVLLCAHGDHGAMGVVINREAPITLGEIMRQLDLTPQASHPQVALLGGPVAPEQGLLLYEKSDANRDEGDRGEGEIAVSDVLRLTPGRDLLQAIAQGEGPQRVHLFLGHAGWASGQLEQEIAHGAWLPVDLNLDLIFEVPLAKRWEESLRLGGLHLAALGGFSPPS